MNGYKIEINDILGSKKIDINTPVIILTNVPKRYLVTTLTDDNTVNNKNVELGVIFNVDTEKLQDDLAHRVQFIDRFIPVGQVVVPEGNHTYNMIMANTRIVPSTNNYEEIKKNVWVGVIRQNNRISTSLGTIFSETKPHMMIPVFPGSFLKKLDQDIGSEYAMYENIYSDNAYGRMILDRYKFNVDKTHLKMIDSTGEISNMFIPVGPRDIIDDNYNDSDKKFSRKVYFTTQGSIVSDSNCVPPRDNMSRMTINECNGIDEDEILVRNINLSNNIQANDDEMLEMNNIMYNTRYSDTLPATKNTKLIKRGKTLVLREKDEPWFRDENIVGAAASTSRPHKVTGICTDRHPCTDGDDMNKYNIRTVYGRTVGNGTLYGDAKEVNAPFKSDCVADDPIIEYSREGTARKCTGIEKFNEDTGGNMDRVNNLIMYSIFIIIIILLIYRRNQ